MVAGGSTINLASLGISAGNSSIHTVGISGGGGGGGGVGSSSVAGKKKRSNPHTEDESEPDHNPLAAKEEDPWALTDQIDASSDYVENHIAGECRRGQNRKGSSELLFFPKPTLFNFCSSTHPLTGPPLSFCSRRPQW